ncbi:hypothetical protein ACFPRL_34565 [Pseudoclavibacter helvolus]
MPTRSGFALAPRGDHRAPYSSDAPDVCLGRKLQMPLMQSTLPASAPLNFRSRSRSAPLPSIQPPLAHQGVTTTYRDNRRNHP